MMRIYTFTIAVILLSIMSSCDIINEEEDIPAYIYINKFELTTNLATEGAASEKITDAWIFNGGRSLGIYELPATLPILNTETNDIRLFPVIRESGIRSMPVIYPMYQEYDVVMPDLQPAQVDTIFPVTTYNSDAKIAWIEDFEGETHSLFTDSVNIAQVNDGRNIYEGQQSGAIMLTEETPTVEIFSDSSFQDLNASGVPVYLEMDYFTDVNLVVGIRGLTAVSGGIDNDVFYKVSLFSTAGQWNKIYISLNEEIALLDHAVYQLAFFSTISGIDTLVSSEGIVLLDNIKLIHL